MSTIKEDPIWGQDLTNRHVILMEKYFRGTSDIRRVFKCEGGFGCNPDTIGRAVFGSLIWSGERFRTERYEVERFATEEEVEEAQKIREKEKKLLVKFKHGWIEGFKFFTGEGWKNYVEMVEKQVQFPKVQYMGKDYFEYLTFKDYFDDIEVKEISELEFDIVSRLFQDGCGCFGILII